jgi:hypothetical protein
MYILKMRLRIGFSFVLFMNISGVYAQETAPVVPPRSLETQFDRGVNRYAWQAQLSVQQPFTKGQFSLRNRFNSEALTLGSSLVFRDENTLFWKAQRTLSSKLEAVLKGNTATFSQNRVFTQEVLGGVRYQPKPFLQVEPAIGFAWDRRTNGLESIANPSLLHLDSGVATALALRYAPSAQNGMSWLLESNNDVQFIAPRQNHLVQTHASFQRNNIRGNQQAQFSVDMRYANLRRDTYQSAFFLDALSTPAEDIEAVTGDTLQTLIQSSIPLNKVLKLVSQGDFSMNNRTIRTLQAPQNALFFDTDLNRRKLNGEVGIEYQKGRTNARISSRFGAETEVRRLVNTDQLPDVQAAQKSDLLHRTDYDRGFFSLNGNVQMPLTKRTQISGNVSSNILHHDTPDTNPDDRDEVFHNGEMRFLVNFTEALALNLQALGTFYHTVYLKAERSAENNVQRSLRLRPAVRWKPSEDLRFTFTPEIRATYTTDDFELAGRLKNDQSARELSYDMLLERRWRNGTELKLDGTYSDLRLGRLLWAKFAEIPFDTVQTASAWVRLKTGTTWTAEWGVKLFQRSDFDRATTLRYNRLDANGNVAVDANGKPIQDALTRYGREIVRQFGPTCAFTLPLYHQSMIRADGWLQFQTIRQRLYGTLPDLPNIREALRGTTRLIPNISLGVLWNF